MLRPYQDGLMQTAAVHKMIDWLSSVEWRR